MESKEENIISWVRDYSRGELSENSKKELESFLNESSENKALFNHYRCLYANGRSIGFLNQLNEEKAWKQIQSSLSKSKIKIRKLHLWLPYAAAVAIIAIVSTILIKQHSSKIDFSKDYNFEQLAQQGDISATITLADGSRIKLEENQKQLISEEDGTQIAKDSLNNIIYTPKTTSNEKLLFNAIDVPRGGEFSLTLSDGTKVWLNADTKFRYPVKFSNSKREVYITGEAYFEVAHNKQAPFVVHSHDAKVKVLGTSFNVSAYEDQEFIATTLVEGAVQINNLGNEKLLKPGYQSIIIRGRDEIEIQEVDTELYTSWVNGVYEFENMELEYIMTQLGRWYDVKFFFTEESFKHIKFTGAFEKENSFEYALNLIERVADVDFAIKGKLVVVGKE
ncbi:FecR domain-containing protein [Marinifilum fragile]|uniref:FecR family protein n=1 Tax=Marinifilum fragile TaxID=570161 RepID=UPI002AA8D3AE|nr:FecR domain-containing protein [Marinifilum fragile]